MKRNEILGERFGRDDDEGHGSNYEKRQQAQMDDGKRSFKRAELQRELGHERNNIQVVINGKPWKVFAGKGTADSPEEFKNLQNMKSWAEKKSAATGKKWSVHLTGADPTMSEMTPPGPPQPGKVQKVNPDGTADVVDAKGTVTKIDQKAIAPDANDPNKLTVNLPKPKLQAGTNISMVSESLVSLKKLAGL